MKNEEILILGFTRRTSFALAKALLSRGARITVSDTARTPEKESLLTDLSALGSVTDRLGNQDISLLDEKNFNLVMPSPGVPLSIPILQEAARRSINIIGDIELFTRLHPEVPCAAITGTDGKTTTTTLLQEILKEPLASAAGGNIGLPVFELEASLGKWKTLVLELSSFQLETVSAFKPKAAAVLNIAEDHLDRYNGVREYMLAKKRIFMNQDSGDTAIVNKDNPWTPELTAGVKSRILSFSRTDRKADAYFDGRMVYIDGRPYMERDGIRMKGIHNVENAMAAILMARVMGAQDSHIRHVLGAFSGVEHRIEFVRELAGVEYYNDSKATTVNAMEKALESFDRPVILLAGGRDKGLDFRLLKDLAAKKLKELVLIGEAGDKIDREMGFKPSYHSKDFEDAVKHAHETAVQGDIVLLSPGCASFDMFKNYEERGKVFKELVNSLGAS